MFEWDPAKAEANHRKHCVAFPDAVGALEDPTALTMHDPHRAEERYVTVGRDFNGRLVTVAWTWWGNTIRPISARPATGRERRRYHEG